MKYLKSIFEAAGEKVELQDFCEMYLAYLIDDGFKVEVSRTSGFKDTLTIKIIAEKGTSTSWDDIKDKLIPFFSMLVKNYNIGADHGTNCHPSWLERKVSFSRKYNSIEFITSINIDKLIEDQPGHPITDINLVKLNVHKK
jgi:hypothetical protein